MLPSLRGDLPPGTSGVANVPLFFESLKQVADFSAFDGVKEGPNVILNSDFVAGAH